MKILLQPKWLFIVNFIPAIILFVIAITQYQIIESLLPEQSKTLWLKLGIALAGINFVQLIYLVICWIKKWHASIIYSVITLISITAFLYAYLYYNSELIPSSIPGWMLTSDVIFYPGTFLMPTLIYSLITIVVASMPQKRKVNPWINLLYSLIFPITGYLFFQIILPLWRLPDGGFGYHVIVVLFTAITILFLFFLLRTIIAFLRHRTKFKGYITLWYILIAFILPTTGLLINNGNYVGGFIFGNFSHPYFYIITFLNSALLCLPKTKNENIRLARLMGLSFFFPYVLYFLLVFLPFLPLSIIAIIVLGIGFLMLSPLLLFILEVRELYKEYCFFYSKIAKAKLIILMAGAFMTIPTLITISNLKDKSTLNNALSYIYDNSIDKYDKVDIISLEKTLKTIKNYKKRNSSFSDNNVPLLSAYYNWLVLDNMILSDEKIKTIERIFFGYEETEPLKAEINTTTAKIASADVSSTFNQQLNLWESTIHFKIKNGDSPALGSYETTFELPTGCWISDYYLYVGKRKERGILAERKSALWIFKQIQNENRDPGIVNYINGNKLAFKVFPFNKGEVRKTGITFIHQGKKTIEIDGKEIVLGQTASPKQETIRKTKNALYLPSSEKTKLTLVQRKPEYHFFLDFSKGKDKFLSSYVERIQRYIENHNINTQDLHIHYTKGNDNKIANIDDWKNNLKSQPFEGGFFLEGAIKKTLTENYYQNKKSYPVLIVVTNKIDNAIFLKGLSDLQFTYPENNSFYELSADGKIWEHSLLTSPIKRTIALATIPSKFPVYSWPNPVSAKAYLPNDSSSSIIIIDKKVCIEHFKQKSFEAALSMQASWQLVNVSQNFGNSEHLELIKQSMKYQILSPVTSFIVVENEAQKKMLQHKQRQILNGNKNLDTDEDTQSMSEPNLWLLIAIIVSILTLKSYYSRKKTATKAI
ncbi:MSEP-CTERM sorting domain-containing protein [Nubsella zeaxanthinifaciens]|uniref:MSEP-CTERM sorting domain-containing protein n=1 Tax=Nubsella zeaxanthinifaciens TaxID=392412 RepID=UPI003D039D3D